MEDPVPSRILKAATTALVVSVMAAPAMAQTTRTCIDTLAGIPEFSQFVNGVVHTHLVQTLRTAPNITMFVPTNDAVNRMPAVRDRLFPRSSSGSTGGAGAETAIASHVVQGRHTARELAQGQQVNSYGGTPITAAAEGGVLILKGGSSEARVTMPDIACSNGVIHGIDSLLVR